MVANAEALELARIIIAGILAILSFLFGKRRERNRVKDVLKDAEADPTVVLPDPKTVVKLTDPARAKRTWS